METNNQIHSFIRLVMNENLAQAQNIIRETLNEKLSAALDEKFEAYAPAIFEALDAVGEEDDDIDNDGIKMTKKDRYLLNRRKVRSAAINEGEEGEEEEEVEEGDEGDETDQNQSNVAPTSAPQVTQQMMPQTMQSSGGSSSAESDGY